MKNDQSQNTDIKRIKTEKEKYGAVSFEVPKNIMKDGIVPGTLKGQNLGLNSKKEMLGPNIKRK